MLYTPVKHFVPFAVTPYAVSSPLPSLGIDLWGSPVRAAIRMQTLIKLQMGKWGSGEVK